MPVFRRVKKIAKSDY